MNKALIEVCLYKIILFPKTGSISTSALVVQIRELGISPNCTLSGVAMHFLLTACNGIVDRAFPVMQLMST